MFVPKFVRGLACAIGFASSVDSCVTPDTRSTIHKARTSSVTLEKANLGTGMSAKRPKELEKM
jgi:hypothetical protein